MSITTETKTIPVAANNTEIGVVHLWEDNGGGLHLAEPGAERVITNVQMGTGSHFAEDAANIADWREDWINQSGEGIWSVSAEEFIPDSYESTNPNDCEHIATYSPSKGVEIHREPGLAATNYLGLTRDQVEGFQGRYPVRLK